MRHLWAVLLISAATLPVLLETGSVGVAQTSDSPPRSSDNGPPPGGCTPIGVTVSGEIVFPMTCMDFIERHKAADRAATAVEKPAAAEVGKSPDAVEAAKAQATVEADKPPDAADVTKAPAAAETSKASTANETGKVKTTGDASRASATAEVTSASATVDVSKTPTASDSGKPEEKDAKRAMANAPADEAPQPETRQAAVSPESADTGKSSAEPGTTAALSKRGRGRNRLASSAPCTRFRTYDAVSGTYRDFGGRRRSCP